MECGADLGCSGKWHGRQCHVRRISPCICNTGLRRSAVWIEAFLGDANQNPNQHFDFGSTLANCMEQRL
jgi:hypothetical protein